MPDLALYFTRQAATPPHDISQILTLESECTHRGQLQSGCPLLRGPKSLGSCITISGRLLDDPERPQFRDAGCKQSTPVLLTHGVDDGSPLGNEMVQSLRLLRQTGGLTAFKKASLTNMPGM